MDILQELTPGVTQPQGTEQAHKNTTHVGFVTRILCKLCVGNVFICRRCIQGRVRKKKEETQFYSKSNTGIEVFPTQVGHPLQVIQHAQADHPSGSYLEEEFTHFVHFLPV